MEEPHPISVTHILGSIKIKWIEKKFLSGTDRYEGRDKHID